MMQAGRIYPVQWLVEGNELGLCRRTGAAEGGSQHCCGQNSSGNTVKCT